MNDSQNYNTLAPAGTQLPKGRIKIYACGGSATNIVRQLEAFRNKRTPGLSELEFVYVDTSAQQSVDIDAEYVYHIPGLDGSGKERKANAAEIAAHVPSILQRHKPLEMNITINSLAGGTGSVAGPEITGALLAADHNVIAIGIGATDSIIDIENTMKTMKSYEGVARNRQQPIVMSYFENSSANPRGVVDKAVVDLITLLSVLFSRENAELDTRDLYNWLRFNRVVPGTGPQLAALSIVEGTNVIPSLGNMFSVATLATTDTGTALSETPAYQAVGYMKHTGLAIDKTAPIHFVTSDGVFPANVVRFEKMLSEYSKNVQARQALNKSTVLTHADNATASGMVL
jgi:hypothetical protein